MKHEHMNRLLMSGALLIALLAAPLARAQVTEQPPAGTPAAPADQQAPQPEPEPESTTQPTSTPEEFKPFGVKLTVPADWKRLPEGRSNVIAKWAIMKPAAAAAAAGAAQPGTADKIGTVVSVEMEPARGRTALMFAQDLLKRARGQIESEDAELGGQRAVRVIAMIAPDPKQPAKPLEALIAPHEGFIYCAAAIADDPNGDQSQAVQDLRQGFEFTEIQAPSNYMTLRSQTVTAFHRMRLRLMATMRPAPEQRRRDAISMRVVNFRRDRPDLVLTIQVLTVKTGATLEQVEKELVSGMASKPDEPPGWDTLGQTPLKVLSKPFLAKGQNREMNVRIGLVQLSPSEVGLLTFGLMTPDNSDRLLYEDKCEEMMKTVEPIKR
jgi:hypothetical protein